MAVSLLMLGIHEVIVHGIRPGSKSTSFPTLRAFLKHRLMLEKWIGVITLGVIPAMAIVLAGIDLAEEIGFYLRPQQIPVAWTLVTAGLILGFSWAASKKMDLTTLHTLMKYPEAIDRWHWANTAVWSIYLFSYEFLMRGLILFSCIALFGVVPAIIINCLIYAGVHLPKDYKEALGSLPFGAVLCLFAVHTQSIWILFILHLLLALAMEWQVVSKVKAENSLKGGQFL
ncbi:MAG: CPBP family intramembrane glutamic endopeptidase [Balneolaceae bacterium]|nr:CPBP family intramembrane glutamic endopeptidase [Balneolaceae bacterium]